MLSFLEESALCQAVGKGVKDRGVAVTGVRNTPVGPEVI